MLPLNIQSKIYNCAADIAKRVEFLNEIFSLNQLINELSKHDVFGYSFFNKESNKGLALNFLLNILQNDEDIDFKVAH